MKAFHGFYMSMQNLPNLRITWLFIKDLVPRTLLFHSILTNGCMHLFVRDLKYLVPQSHSPHFKYSAVVASGYHFGQHRSRTFLSSQKVLSDSTALEHKWLPQNLSQFGQVTGLARSHSSPSQAQAAWRAFHPADSSDCVRKQGTKGTQWRKSWIWTHKGGLGAQTVYGIWVGLGGAPESPVTGSRGLDCEQNVWLA